MFKVYMASKHEMYNMLILSGILTTYKQ